MITERMVSAAWRAMPSWMQEGSDPDEVRRILAAAMAEYHAANVVIPQHPDAEGDW